MSPRTGKEFTMEQKMNKLQDQGCRCASCGRPLDPRNHGGPGQGLKWDAHHRHPIEDGGTGSSRNCVILCKDCHGAIHDIMRLNSRITFDTADQIWAYARKLMHTRRLPYDKAILWVMRDAGYI